MDREEARRLLWEFAEKMSDEEVDDLLCNMRSLVSKIFDAYEEWILPIKNESE